ncbi:serine/threonine-protein kinase [Candidatus Eisenbacteria bacterium]|uniref:Serine/threonine-protein kinase n=1 Tax=Eiseniibacteriota bacterium TaxID=2212470 RepID=A0ABV6YLC7_UNCEI
MSQVTHFIRKAGVTPSTGGSLPSDITDIVFKRIIILCLLSAGMTLLGSTICVGSILTKGVFLNVGGYKALEAGKDVLTILVSLGLAWIVHRRKFHPRTLIALGLGFGAYVALHHSVGECLSLVYDEFTPIAFFSFVQGWVVFFPAIVPIRSRTAYFMILLAAAMPPLSRGVTQSLGYVELPEDSLAILTIIMSFSAIMGLAVSHVVYKLGRSVKAAREMGSYTLEKNLGGGGMGEVWLASHRLLARPAAVKLIKPEVLAGMQPGDIEKMNQRFEREVQATAALCSPHTVDIYDYGLAQDGTFYYVMELLDGIDMETLIKRFGPIEPSRVTYYMIQACHSLNEAHKRQLIHRDIKPANLFVCSYGEDSDFVKVLDFGLVKQDKAESEADMKLTVDGAVAGTPAYMYPEAFSGKSPVDNRSDIYSLGCVAYWLLTGQLVFTAETRMAMLMAHATDKPAPPSKRSEMVIPEDLDNVILACLAKKPGDRPQSANELAGRLRRIVFGQPWDQERAQAWWKLHRPG